MEPMFSSTFSFAKPTIPNFFGKMQLLIVAFVMCLIGQAHSSSITITLDERATYIKTNFDPGARPSIPVSLSALGINAGDTIVLQVQGKWKGCPPPCTFTTATIGLFSSNITVRGSLPSGLPAIVTQPDIPDDFDVTNGVTVQVPAGAQFLFVAANDIFYGDNPRGNYGVVITSPGTIPPSISFRDASQTSGIANQNIRTSGLQWIDFNKDRRIDLFFVGTNGVALFRNNGNKTFTEVTKQSKLDQVKGNVRGGSWADFDNDGDSDLFLAASTGPIILRNNKGVFVNVTPSTAKSKDNNAGGTQAGIWLDFNNDKRVDLFIVNDGRPNQLFKQSGFAGYEDIAASAGLATVATGRASVAADFNNDGFDDLLVLNFNQGVKLYLNNQDETFRDITRLAKVNFSCACVQAAVADYDNDGFLDIFVVNSNGKSRLFRNKGNLRFENKTKISRLNGPDKAVAAAFADFDLDADDDLVIVQSNAQNAVYRNNLGRFEVVRDIDLSNPDNPTGIAVGDFNNDGTPDIAIGDADESGTNGDSLYENTGGPGNNFLIVTLQGRESNKSAIGARVFIQTAFTFQAKTVNSGNGQSEESLPLEFGVGVAPIIDLLHILWPSGNVQDVKDVKANIRLTIKESSN